LLVAVGLFVVNYSRINVVKHTLSGASFQSRVTRASRLRTILYARSDQTHILQLQGYLFFGTAHRLLELVRGRLQQTDVPPVRFLVLDFRQVTGLDSTAILSFAKMKHLAHDSAAVLIFTGLSPTLEAQFVSNRLGGAEDTVKVFPDLDRAVEWCEAEILRVEGVEDEAESIQQHIEQILPEAGNMEALLQYLKREEVAQGAYLFRQGDAPDVLYLVEKGQVTAQLESASEKAPTRLETMRGGRVVGEIGFYRGVARTAAVRADEPTVVYSLARAQLKQMEQADPETASTFHRLMVHLLAERVTHLIRAVDALLK
jgi:SulP family sulfate permease